MMVNRFLENVALMERDSMSSVSPLKNAFSNIFQIRNQNHDIYVNKGELLYKPNMFELL